MIKPWITLALLAPLGGNAMAQRTSGDSAEVSAVLKEALAPLKSMSRAEMNAVATLVLVSRIGIDVSDYCPPLKTLAVARPGCVDAELAYASAAAKCDQVDDAKCPEAAVALGNLMSCKMSAFQKLYPPLGGLRVPGIPPRPLRAPVDSARGAPARPGLHGSR